VLEGVQGEGQVEEGGQPCGEGEKQHVLYGAFLIIYSEILLFVR